MKKISTLIFVLFSLLFVLSFNTTAENADREYLEEVTENGSEYSLFTIDKSLNSSKIVIILIPSELDQDEFLDSTQWLQYASEDYYNIAILRNEWLNAPDDAGNYYEDVYSDLAEYIDFTEKDIFVVGYDEGAQFAIEEVCRNHDRYTGLVSFGDYGLDVDQRNEYLPDVYSWNMNVWITSEKSSTLLNQNIGFWKKINNITSPFDQKYSVNYADFLYMPATSTADKIHEEDSGTGIVYFDLEDDYYSRLETEKICLYFISAINNNTAGFLTSIYGGELIQINDTRFSYYRQNFGGAQREYWMYVPSSYESQGEPSSLLLCLHGNYGSGTDMILRTRWNTIAEENNCIVIFPSSLYKAAFQHYWQNIDEEMDWLRSLLDNTCEDYNIDRSRIYVTGYSNGAGMAHNLAVNFSDIIAAAGMGAPIYYDEDYFGAPDNIDPVAVVYSIGTEDKYLKEYEYTADIDDYPAMSHLAYWRMMYGFDQNSYDYLDENGVKIYTFNNMDGIPVCSWVVIEGKGHTYPAAECQNMWDFMSSYTKDEEGNLYFFDEKVDIMRR